MATLAALLSCIVFGVAARLIVVYALDYRAQTESDTYYALVILGLGITVAWLALMSVASLFVFVVMIFQ